MKPGYKQTEVGVIPEEWEALDLSDLCTLQRGFDITEATAVAGTFPVYSSSGLSYFHNKAMVEPPGVVTGRKGILGKVFLIEEPFWPHDTTLWVKDFKGNHAGYVALVLKNFHLERLDAATSVPTLNRNNLSGNRIPYTRNEAEQEAIAEALSDGDALIESLEQLLAKKRHLKQGAMQELLTGKTRLPGFSGEWKVKPIAEVFTISTATSKSAHVDSGGAYWIADMGSVSRDGRLIVSKRTNYHADFLRLGDLVMPKDDIGGGNIIGKVGYIDADKKYVLGDHVYCLRAQLGNPLFLSYVINAAQINSALRKKVIGSAQLGLGRRSVEEQEIVFPGLPEQSAIADVLSVMEAETIVLETKLAKIRCLKQGMMHELLTGRIRLV